MRAATLVAIGLALAGPVLAVDYRPVVCTSAKPYAGDPAKAPDVSAAFMPGDLTTAPLASEVQQRLNDGLASAREKTGAPAMTAAVAVPGQGQWQSTLGETGDRLFYWASAGKTFTAIAILQLAEEGRLSLSDPVSKWIGGVPNGDVITVAHLLDHTSGLFSANEDLAFHKKPHRMDLKEELKILNRHGAMFCPGENWRYSNSGYALLGEILEKVESKPYDQVIRARVIDRLGLQHTRIVLSEDSLTDVVPPVSSSAEASADPRQAGAAGGVAASAGDMMIVWQALLTGRLVKPETAHSAFAHLYPMFGQPSFYGQGVMAYAPPQDASIVWVGHSGSAPGVKAAVVYSLKDKAFVAVALTGDGPAEATVAPLLRALK